MTHPYATEAYAKSLAHWGEALHVPEWECSVIVRDVAQGGQDACGTYPLAVLPEHADLSGGLARLRAHGLISVTLVLDDFHRPSLQALQRHFSVIKKFKTHYIRQIAEPFAYAKHHRYRIGRAYRRVQAGPVDLAANAAEWRALYATLAGKHQLTGVHDFPKSYFDVLETLPGVTAFGAWLDGRLVSVQSWVDDGVHVHGHLAASSPAGYQEGAAYAAYDASMAYFRDAALINLGGGAGVDDDPADGLAVFKRGFANDVAPAFICGAVLDETRYQSLSSGPTDFFPNYRAPKL